MDVYSFGIMLFEIFSSSKTSPFFDNDTLVSQIEKYEINSIAYEAFDNGNMKQSIKNLKSYHKWIQSCILQDTTLPSKIKTIILDCINYDAKDRPTGAELSQRLKNLCNHFQ